MVGIGLGALGPRPVPVVRGISWVRVLRGLWTRQIDQIRAFSPFLGIFRRIGSV